jgi:hypothetical protein
MADSIIKYSDLIGKDDTFDVIFANIEKLQKELTDLAQDTKKGINLINPNDEKALKEAVQQVEKLGQAKKKLDAEEKKAVKTKKKLNELTNEELIQREKLKIVNRERIQKAKQLAVINNKESGEIEKLRARLSLTTLAWKKLSKEELNNTNKGKALIASKLKLTNQLKKLEKQTGDNRRNVGNYTDALKGNLGVMGSFGGVIGTLSRGFGSVLGILPKIVLGFKTLRGAIISTGIGALAIALISLITYLSKTQRGADFVSRAFATIGAAIDVIVDRISKFGEAIAAAFGGDFAKASKLFKESVTGIGTEIQKEANQALSLERALQKVEKREIGLIAINAKKARQIAELERLAEENKNNDKKRAAEQLKDAIKLQQQISDAEVSIAKERARIKSAQVAASESTNDDLREEAQLIANVENVEKQREDRIRGLTRKLNSLIVVKKKNTKSTKDSTKAIKDNTEQRIAAIESLEQKIRESEADGEDDKTARLIALEDVKFKALQKKTKEDFEKYKQLLIDQEKNLIALYGQNSAQVIAFRDETGKELLAVEAKNLKLSELQLQESENRKLKIYEDADKKIIDRTTKIVKEAQKLRDKGQSDEEKFIEEQGKKAAKQAEGIQKGVEDEQKKTAEATKARTDELLKGIKDTTAKIGAAIVATFEKQADVAASLVEDQADAVEVQRERAEKGLSNTLKFEQEQLAQREAERIRAEKKAKQAAEFVTLLNLVSAYAAGGDANALARGLVDFSLLKALEAGFEEGGYTGDNGTSDIAGVVHGKEFVVTADDVKRYGLAGKSGGDFGEAMSDYFYSPLQQNLYNGQADNFKSGMGVRPNDFTRLEDEMRAMRRAFQAVPKNDFDILQMTDYFVDISKRVTSNRMTKVSKQRKRL